MPRGKETSPEVVAKFRAHYLFSGDASESAREVGISESTGRDIARKLQTEESFGEDRRMLRVRALDELVAMRMRVARKATERAMASGEYGPGEIDKRPDWGRIVIEAEKAAHNLARLDSEKSGEVGRPTEVVIQIAGGEDDPKAGDK